MRSVIKRIAVIHEKKSCAFSMENSLIKIKDTLRVRFDVA
jgi:hypothetical protein